MKINFYLGFNNYYNREVKKFDNIEDYEADDKHIYRIYTIDNVNFKPNDGINTTQKVNTTQVVDYTPFLIDKTPDYAIVCEDNNTIVSRWFVMQFERIRAGQYEAVLRRDVIADNFDKIIEAPCFIEKATIKELFHTINNQTILEPAVFNNENMGFNQIKKDEILLKDESKISWIVGYVPSTFPSDNNPIEFDYKGDTYQVAVPQNATVANNMPFKIFCIPYENVTCFKQESDTYPEFTTDKDLGFAFATKLASELGSGNVFDIQLLPYCPIRAGNNDTCYFIPDGTGEREGKYELYANGDYLYIHKKADADTITNAKQVIFWNVSNKFSFDITVYNPYLWIPSSSSSVNDVREVKVRNECDMWRLCSPNYQGQFEFSAMKNLGVAKFNVDCLYQPYSPYIHINPVFNDNSLYGTEYNDARGLICGGDFSLPQETSAWANYVQNNKNYQASFDRQITNMERMNSYQMTSQVASGIVGTLQGVATGAMGGNLVGGPLGGLIGGVAGGLASTTGGVVDTLMLASQQKETLDYTKDQFGYQMGNIKAMPNSVSKSNPITNNNKIFPVLEYYSCTELEKYALQNKLIYNGMTIGRIGKIKDWLLPDYSYIKGQIIKLDDVAEDYHTALTIADEVNKGIRVKED